MIWPEPCSPIPGSTACATRSEPSVFTSTIRCTSSIGTVSSGPRTVALALLDEDVDAARAGHGRVYGRLVGYVEAQPQGGRDIVVVDATSRAVAITSWPRAESATAVPRPIPRDAPVIRMRAMSRNPFFSLLVCRPSYILWADQAPPRAYEGAASPPPRGRSRPLP